MKKKFCLSIYLALTWCVSQNSLPLSAEGRVRVISKDVTLREHHRHSDLVLHYPCFIAVPHSSAVNAALKQFITKRISQWQSQQSYQIDNSLSCSYTSMVENQEVVSIMFVFESTTGFGRALTETACLNFAPEKSQVIRLSEVFRRDDNYLELLSILSICHFLDESEDFDVNSLRDSLSPNEKNFRDFCLTADGIKLYFDEGQIGSEALGPQSFTVKYALIYSVLSESFKSGAAHSWKNLKSKSQRDLNIELRKLAIGAYTKRIVKQPECIGAYLERAKWYRSLNRNAEADKDLRSAATFQPPITEHTVDHHDTLDKRSIIFSLILLLFPILSFAVWLLFWKRNRS